MKYPCNNSETERFITIFHHIPNNLKYAHIALLHFVKIKDFHGAVSEITEKQNASAHRDQEITKHVLDATEDKGATESDLVFIWISVCLRVLYQGKN